MHGTELICLNLSKHVKIEHCEIVNWPMASIYTRIFAVCCGYSTNSDTFLVLCGASQGVVATYVNQALANINEDVQQG